MEPLTCTGPRKASLTKYHRPGRLQSNGKQKKNVEINTLFKRLAGQRGTGAAQDPYSEEGQDLEGQCHCLGHPRRGNREPESRGSC